MKKVPIVTSTHFWIDKSEEKMLENNNRNHEITELSRNFNLFFLRFCF